MRIKSLRLFVTLFISLFIISCSHTQKRQGIRKDYSGTPYDLYSRKGIIRESPDNYKGTYGIFGTNPHKLSRVDKTTYGIQPQIRKAFKDSSNASLHRYIARLAIDNNQYVLALYAFSEISRLNKLSAEDNYNLGVIFSIYGLTKIATSKLMFAQEKSENFFVKNKATASLLKIEADQLLTGKDLFINN